MKEKIVSTIFEVLKDDMALDVTNIGKTDRLANLADTDDLSFIFVPELEKRFGVSVPVEKWSEVDTIDEVAEMLNTYVESSNDI